MPPQVIENVSPPRSARGQRRPRDRGFRPKVVPACGGEFHAPPSLAFRNVTPVLSDQGLARCLGPLGGPPRILWGKNSQKSSVNCSLNASMVSLAQTGSADGNHNDDLDHNQIDEQGARLPREFRPPLSRVTSWRRPNTGHSASGQSLYSQSVAPSVASAMSRPQRPPSPLTLTETLHTRAVLGKAGYIPRGIVDVAVAQKDNEVCELAGHRAYCKMVAQSHDRQNAVIWRKRREVRIQKNILEWMDSQDQHDLDKVPFGAVASETSNARSRRLSVINDHLDEEDFEGGESPSARQNPSLLFVDSSSPEHLGQKEKKRVSVIDSAEIVVGKKSPKDQRLRRLSKLCHDRKRTEKRLIEAQRELDELLDQDHHGGDHLEAGQAVRRFTALPSKDQQGFRRVFAEYDKDGSNTLDWSELKNCLADLGLRGKNEEERAEIYKIIASSENSTGEIGFYEFSLELVPKVRTKLAELQRDHLRNIYIQADEDKSNMLSTDEALNILRLMGTYPSEELVLEALHEVVPEKLQLSATSMSGEWIRTKDILDFSCFEKLIRTLQERHERSDIEKYKSICAQENLTAAEQKRWRHELTTLYDHFNRYDSDKNGMLDGNEVQKVVNENNLAPKSQNEKLYLDIAIAETARVDGMHGFREFLLLIKRLRSLSRQRLQRLFSKYDKDGSGFLSLSEVMTVLFEFGIHARNKSEQYEIRALLEDADEDGSGELDFEEFCLLHQHVQDKMKTMQKEVDRQLGLKLGFGETDIMEYREAFEFLDVDGTGDLDMPELRTAMERLKRNISVDEMWGIFDTLNVDRKKGKVDFQTFLHLMRMIEDKQGMFADLAS